MPAPRTQQLRTFTCKGGDFLRIVECFWQSFPLARNMRPILDMRGIGARFVYILRSSSDSARHYVGRASNVDERLEWHNAGPDGYTRQHRPWSIVVVLEFPDEGRAFAKRHFAASLLE